jgi:Bacterial transcriptional regulator
VLGVAAPVKSPSGVVVAVVSIAGPEQRMRQSDLSQQAAAVRKAAESISRELGFAEARPNGPKMGFDIPCPEQSPVTQIFSPRIADNMLDWYGEAPLSVQVQ